MKQINPDDYLRRKRDIHSSPSSEELNRMTDFAVKSFDKFKNKKNWIFEIEKDFSFMFLTSTTFQQNDIHNQPRKFDTMNPWITFKKFFCQRFMVSCFLFQRKKVDGTLWIIGTSKNRLFNFRYRGKVSFSSSVMIAILCQANDCSVSSYLFAQFGELESCRVKSVEWYPSPTSCHCLSAGIPCWSHRP